jgi:hypothetical protein
MFFIIKHRENIFFVKSLVIVPSHCPQPFRGICVWPLMCGNQSRWQGGFQSFLGLDMGVVSLEDRGITSPETWFLFCRLRLHVTRMFCSHRSVFTRKKIHPLNHFLSLLLILGQCRGFQFSVVFQPTKQTEADKQSCLRMAGRRFLTLTLNINAMFCALRTLPGIPPGGAFYTIQWGHCLLFPSCPW